ncbi:MAG: methyltransferase domain-containing protein [Lentisphaeraceae bacterium]|nr:methyltransferase domain-containing protein [Lentisphaeraceae bacterium]
MSIKFLLSLLLIGFLLNAEQPINTEKPGIYLGRQIAYTMHSDGADWLTRSEREKEESTKEMIKALGLKKGMTVADIGCGNGYHSLEMAKLVGESGTVFCVDVQFIMLKLLEKRAREAGIKNCKTILGEFTDPKLPKGKVDLILLVDAYHEFTDPEAMLIKMKESLSENGQIVFLEFRKEDKKVPIKEDHKMSKKQISKELLHNGFKLVRSYDKLPWQHMMFFGRDKK